MAVSGYFSGEATFEGAGRKTEQRTALGASDGFGMLLGAGEAVFSGGFSGSATWETATGDTPMLESWGQWDGFVVSYDAMGQALWAEAIHGLENDEAVVDVVEAPGGSVAAVGRYASVSATFGEGGENETTLSTSASGDAFVALYDPTGRLAWVRGTTSSGGGFGASMASIARTDAGSVTCGYFDGQTTLGAGESAETTWESAGWDAFVAAFDPEGTLRWARRTGGVGDDWSRGVAAVGSDWVAVVGRFEGDAWVDTGSSGPAPLSWEGGKDIFVAYYDQDGTLSWVVQSGGPGDDEAYSVAALPDGGLWVAGSFSEQATFGTGAAAVTLESAGAEDIFVARYDADGTLLSAQRAGGAFTDRARGVAALESGDAVVTGAFSDEATFFPGTEFETRLTSRGGLDIFVARMPP